MDWKHGYFAESGYTYGYYPEVSPIRLAWIAALKGQRSPGSRFRYLDLGCGQGLGLLMLASAYPDAEFVGIDFMPEHIAHARYLAQAAGLSNVRLIEGDFLALNTDSSVQADLGGAGSFDYAVAHGITTWIAPEVREALFGITGKLLRPGGMFYNSYNTYPGWLAAAPFQHLVSQLQLGNSGRGALQSAMSIMEQMQTAGSALFAQLPGLKQRIEGMKKQDMAYLVQEYNNAYWAPVFCSTMLGLAAQHKMQFLASATLPEVFENSLPEALQPIIKAQTDPTLAETVRDLAINQSFRRDIYVKGSSSAWLQEQLATACDFRFIRRDGAALPEDGKDFIFNTAFGTITGKREAYAKLFTAFGDKGATLAQVLQGNAKLKLPALTQMVSLMVHGGWLAVEQPQFNAKPAQKLNAVIAQASLDGAPYRFLALPRIADAAALNDSELMLVGLLQRGTAPIELPTALDTALRGLNRAFLHDGKPVNDATAALAQAKVVSEKFVSQRLPELKRLGAL